MSEDHIDQQSVHIEHIHESSDPHPAAAYEVVEYDDDDMDESDWEDIIATTEEDARAGRVAFSSAGCHDEESLMKALDVFLDSILAEVLGNVATSPGMVASR